MNRTSFLLIAPVALTAVAFSWAAPTTQPDLASENQRLRERVQKLEQRVRALQRELELKEWSQPFSLVPPSVPPSAPQFAPQTRPSPYDLRWSLPQSPNGNRVPPHWVPREFNGERYYLVPLQQKTPTPGE